MARWVLPYKTKKLKDDYFLGRVLGQGQFGTIFLCTHKETGQKLACKSIPKRNLRCQEDCDKVLREIQIMHHLSEYPNVVRIHNTYEDDTSVHIVMELCEGGELFDRIAEKGHYSEREAAKVIKSIVSVVEACHSLGVMHRDLKPENFLFSSSDEDSSLKSIDFGVSVFCEPGTRFSELVGSPYYVAPEVLLKHYGRECDVWSAGVILYALLCGFVPFSAGTDSGIFEEILRGKLDFETDPWPSISKSAKDLTMKMLESNPKKRLTAHQVLCHPWILDDTVAPDKPLDFAVVSRLKRFSAMNKLKKMALRVVAEGLSEEEIGGLKELFKMIDTDNSGTITFEELKDSIRRVGSELVESEIQQLLSAADVDESGTIDYGEFLAATIHLNKLEREENLLAAFAFFDKDSSGSITMDELQEAWKQFGVKDSNLDAMIKDIDQDNDGKINYGEFVAMMRKGNDGICVAPLDPSAENFDWIKDVWASISSPKMKVFIWSIIQKALPLGETLQTRGIQAQALCPRCKQTESTMHIFFHCKFSKQVWIKIPLHRVVHLATDAGFKEAIVAFRKSICLPPSGVTGSILPWVCWAIWTARNTLIFENRSLTQQEVATKAIRLARKWNAAQSQKEVKTQTVHGSNRRNLICKTDAAWEKATNKGGLGWIISDSAGAIIRQGATVQSFVNSPIVAEALALRLGLIAAVNLDLTSIKMISDNLTLIRAINTGIQVKEIFGVVKDIQQISSVFVDISFSHLPRLHLAEVHLLAKRTLLGCSVISSVP